MAAIVKGLMGLCRGMVRRTRTLRLFQEMNFVLAPNKQPLVSIRFADYPDESDLNGRISPYGLYPIPMNKPIEGWPTQTSGETLAQAQQDTLGLGGDRHSIVVQPGNGFLWETWRAFLSGTNWQAANGAMFNLATNRLRPAGWTSGDATGLPMFPALVRFDECERGMMEHACRIVVKRTRYNTALADGTRRYRSAKRWAMGMRRPRPKALVVTFRPGAAWRRLYSLPLIRRTTRCTAASSYPRATISAGGLSSTT
jgi:hypothetical protein